MRQGEVLGLQWATVDLKARTPSVRRALLEIRGKLSTGEPKSARGGGRSSSRGSQPKRSPSRFSATRTEERCVSRTLRRRPFDPLVKRADAPMKRADPKASV